MQREDTVTATEHILKQRNYPRQPAYLLAAMEDVASQFGAVPVAAKELLLDYFGIDEIPAEIASALDHRHGSAAETLTLCAGPICSQAGSDELAALFEETGGVNIERQHCMGACDRAPCARAGGKLIAPAAPESIASALNLPSAGQTGS